MSPTVEQAEMQAKPHGFAVLKLLWRYVSAAVRQTGKW